MSIYYPGSDCGSQIAGYNSSCCPRKEGARIRHVWFQKNTYEFTDAEDADEWTTAITAYNVVIIPNVRGSSDGGVWTTSEGFGDVVEEAESYEETITYTDPNYLNNVANYNALARSKTYRFGFCTATLGYLSDQAASFKPKRPIQADIKQSVYGDVEVKFVQTTQPIPFTYPQSIFNCFQVIIP